MRTWKLRVISVLTALCFLVPCLCSFVYAVEMPARTIRVGYFDFDGYHMTDASGARSGYGYEYLQEMAKFTNWQYTYVDCSWAEAQDLLERGEIDILTSAQKTEERLHKFDFSDYSIGQSNAILTVRSDNLTISANDYEAMDGIRIGLLQGNSRNAELESYSKTKAFSYTPVLFESTEDLTAALSSGTVDAILTSNLRRIYNERIIAEFAPSPYYVMVQKGDTDLLREVNYALEQIGIDNPNFALSMYQKYYRVSGSTGFAFTDAERRYLEDHRTVKLVLPPDTAPMVYESNGICCGIVPDILRKLGKLAGLDVSISATKTFDEFSLAMEDPTVDGFGFVHEDLSLAESMNVRLTSSFMTLNYSLLYPAEVSMHLDAVGTIAQSNLARTYLSHRYPATSIRSFPDYESCFAALENGEIDSTIVNTYVAQWMVQESQTHALQSTMLSGVSRELCLGIPYRDDNSLFSILNKAANSLPSESVDEIVTRHITAQVVELTFWEYLTRNPMIFMLLITGAFLLICGLLLVFMQYRFRSRQRLLYSEAVRFGTLVCDAYDQVMELNLLTNSWETLHVADGQLVRDAQKISANWFNNMEYRVHPEDFETFKKFASPERMKQLVSDMEISNFECRFRQADGSYRWYDILLQGLLPDKKHRCNVMLYSRDIQALKQEEAVQRTQLLEALESAQRASAAKGSFMSRISHEIRTPLNAIIGFLGIAKKHAQEPVRVCESMEKASFAAKHLLTLVNDVLDMSTIENGTLKLSEDPFSFHTLITSLVSIFYAQAERKQVRFVVIMEDVIEETLCGDAMRLNQILMNLLSNAVKFTPAGGTVTLKISRALRREQQIYLRFSVMDTGIGMSQAFLERIGTPFEQADASIGQRFGGTGLGVSITKNLTTLMQGVMTISSREGEGSTFTVELPFRLTPEEPSGSSAKVRFNSIHALVVDADASISEYEAVLLRNCGVDCISACGGQAAIAQIAKRHREDQPAFDICLLDWRMSDLSGQEMIREIRAVAGDSMPIVVVADYDCTKIEQEARDAGAVLFVAKPLFQSTVLDLLVNLYGKYEVDPLPATFSEVQPKLQGKRVILAEDNALNMEIAVELLQDFGIQADQAVNGEAALQRYLAAEAGTYDGIILDVQMPVMDGYAAAREIRASGKPDAKTIPILAMTANAFAEDIAASLAAGMNDHIAKPIDVSQMQSILDT